MAFALRVISAIRQATNADLALVFDQPRVGAACELAGRCISKLRTTLTQVGQLLHTPMMLASSSLCEHQLAPRIFSQIYRMVAAVGGHIAKRIILELGASRTAAVLDRLARDLHRN